MNEELILKRKFLSILSIAVIGLLILSTYLYRERRVYKEKNDQLLLQNDSLISVNIRLKSVIDSVEQPGFTTRLGRR